jgi:hypothetical protein
MSKHNYIREVIRDTLEAKGLKIATVISNGFHTSLRNAFAHSEYNFNDLNKFIHLDTYKGGTWDIDKISYDNWTKRFAYSALLSYHFLNVRARRRMALPNDYGTNEFVIFHPRNHNRFTMTTIHYDETRDSFSFHR